MDGVHCVCGQEAFILGCILGPSITMIISCVVAKKECTQVCMHCQYYCRIMIKNINTTNLKTFIQCNQHYTHLQHNDRITLWTLANQLTLNFLFLWTIMAYKCGYPNNKQILYRANTQLVEILVLEMEKTWTNSCSH